MNKEYKKHLCTFMGREANLKILLPYIEGALLNDAIDHYWFIDMTRKRSDHEYIKQESKRLNEKYPGRVHLYNSEERGKIIDSPEEIEKTIGQWDTFYKFLKQFKDNDIIAKCDDDTYFIDISTLSSAFDFRWRNQKPYLMHANAINNGVCAYHQGKKGIWKYEDVKTYPPKGLSGPVFSNAKMACDMHKTFAVDLTKNINNLEKYKLGKNILFANRVSINFIFMLGKDRAELSKITSQDEFDTSSKYAQREDRPNLIIGDFIMSHHTYGSQEETMEELGTDKWYKELVQKIDPANTKVDNREICTKTNSTSTICQDGYYIMRSWVDEDTYIIKDPTPKDGRDYIIKMEEVNNTGNVMMTYLTTGGSFEKACLFKIKLDKPNAIWLKNSNQILKPPPNPPKNEAQTPMLGTIGGWTKIRREEIMKFVVKKTSKNKCTIHCAEKELEKLSVWPTHKHSRYGKNCKDRVYLCMLEDYEWELVPMKGYVNNIVAGKVERPKDFLKYYNDQTRTTCLDLPELSTTDYTWTIQDYIWEFIPTKQDNVYYIKLIADDKQDMYLHYNNKKNKIITGKKQEWKYVDKGPKYLQHVQTGLYLDIQGGVVTMNKKLSKLAINPEK